MPFHRQPPPAVRLPLAFANCRPADCGTDAFLIVSSTPSWPFLAVDVCVQNLTLSVGLSDRSLFLYVCSLLIGVNIFRCSAASSWLAWMKTDEYTPSGMKRFVVFTLWILFNVKIILFWISSSWFNNDISMDDVFSQACRSLTHFILPKGKKAMLSNAKYSNNFDVDYWGLQSNTMDISIKYKVVILEMGQLISFDCFKYLHGGPAPAWVQPSSSCWHISFTCCVFIYFYL